MGINNSKEIILGSGELYMVTFDGTTIPDDATIEVEGNRAGNISKGAVVTYSATSKKVSSDNGLVKLSIITEEFLTLKTGMMTWAENWLKACISTARLDTSAPTGRRKYKIGGLAHQHNERYLFRFVHKKTDGRKVRFTLTGPNTGEVGINFNNDDPTTIDAEISAEPLDNEGTLAFYDEELDTTTTTTQ